MELVSTHPNYPRGLFEVPQAADDLPKEETMSRPDYNTDEVFLHGQPLCNAAWGVGHLCCLKENHIGNHRCEAPCSEERVNQKDVEVKTK